MSESRWRLHSRRVIREAAEQNKSSSDSELRKIISNAYPFGARKYHPYKIWLKEVKLFFEQRRKISQWGKELF